MHLLNNLNTHGAVLIDPFGHLVIGQCRPAALPERSNDHAFLWTSPLAAVSFPPPSQSSFAAAPWILLDRPKLPPDKVTSHEQQPASFDHGSYTQRKRGPQGDCWLLHLSPVSY